ncbi:SpoIIE family protein phosphatase, partial [Candidatus Omnitrophota bacterium]
LDVFKDASVGTGFVNVEPDIDGKVRWVPSFVEYKGIRHPQLTVLVALNDLGHEFDWVEVVPEKKMIVTEEFVMPLGRRSSMLVNYPDVWGKAFRHYSYIDILQSYLADVTGQKPSVNLKDLKDTVCFIGFTATASPDAHPSPMEPLYPGVGLHASVYNSIVSRNFVWRLNRWCNLLILIALWLFTGYVTLKSRKRFAMLSLLFIMAAYVFMARYIFQFWGIWIDVFYPLVTVAVIYLIITFKKYLTETRKREIIEKELDIAKDIQQSFLPTKIPSVRGIDVSVRMETAQQVGGDLYDMIQMDEDKLGVMVGDVSGKGVPAALYMARLVSVFTACAREGTPREVVKHVNDRLVSEGGSNLFVTLTYMVFDTESRTVTFAVGGHPPTILIEPDGNVKLLDVEEGLPLGLVEGGFSEGKWEYKPGSLFVLYTDGVTEAKNTHEEMFTQERLVELVKTFKGLSAEEVIDSIHGAVADFAGKAKQYDDITVMAIKT